MGYFFSPNVPDMEKKILFTRLIRIPWNEIKSDGVEFSD
jgi:hypothetical protein